jgi:predicted RNA-binding Zn-ribbon protein involved in translation (DUF1610 family)
MEARTIFNSRREWRVVDWGDREKAVACPGCGGEDIRLVEDRGNWGRDWTCQCAGCGWLGGWELDPRHAVERWNRGAEVAKGKGGKVEKLKG